MRPLLPLIGLLIQMQSNKVECELSHTAETRVIGLYERGGMAVLQLGQRGRRTGEDRQRTADQELQIQRMICEKRPEQLKMEFALSSRAAACQLL